ncbi:uncharacterized protein LOC113027638 [Astatotilapia calliptera]|uniref:uncharacterized protein LOC113027638 n=1 Tax=Astatotilapia calliptera TaxID=8154 RepID=UPI000E42B23A|nr:uncharacterized protein LOC113027638 [Astatotilapia calliptera]
MVLDEGRPAGQGGEHGAGTGACLFGLRPASPGSPAPAARWSSASVTATSKLAGRWHRTHLAVSAGNPSVNCSSTTLSTSFVSPSDVPGCSQRTAASRSCRAQANGRSVVASRQARNRRRWSSAVSPSLSTSAKLLLDAGGRVRAAVCASPDSRGSSRGAHSSRGHWQASAVARKVSKKTCGSSPSPIRGTATDSGEGFGVAAAPTSRSRTCVCRSVCSCSAARWARWSAA